VINESSWPNGTPKSADVTLPGIANSTSRLKPEVHSPSRTGGARPGVAVRVLGHRPFTLTMRENVVERLRRILRNPIAVQPPHHQDVGPETEMSRALNGLEDFECLMREIDAAMHRDAVPIHLREIVALSEAAKLLGLELVGYPRKQVPTPGVYTAEDLPAHIFEWVRRRYGDRLNFDFTNGYAVLAIRGDPWLLGFPIIYGSVNVICDRDLTRKSSGIKVIDPNDRSTWPSVNVLTCIRDLPQDLASQLTAAELRNVMQFFLFGHEFLNDLNSFCRGQPLAMSALADLNASSRACVLEGEYGLSRWASLQAVEKLLKFYIEQKGKRFPSTHNLSVLTDEAAALGLPAIDAAVLGAVQCEASVRYEKRNHAVVDVVAANHAVLTIGGTVIQTLYPHKQASSRPTASVSDPPFHAHTVQRERVTNETKPLANFREFTGSSDSPGRLLERLVAGMHVAETPDIEVRWNDKINGRQFDVSLRFRKGVHDYLTVIECKDFAGPVSVKKSRPLSQRPPMQAPTRPS
jgi:hypothetical protein